MIAIEGFLPKSRDQNSFNKSLEKCVHSEDKRDCWHETKKQKKKKKKRKTMFYVIFDKVEMLKILLLSNYVVPSISFQPFFVQALKIVIDSWNFTMLLLYIWWDDWPIIMF